MASRVEMRSTGTDRGKHFNISRTVHDNGSQTFASDDIMITLLSDIRDELKEIHAILGCVNTVGIPHTLKRIDRRLATRFGLRKGRR